MNTKTTKNPTTLYTDKQLRVALTSKCNLRCIYCGGSLSDQPDRTGSMEDFRRSPIKNGCISTNKYFDFIRLFQEAGFNKVAFTGGEPLLNPDWDLIVNESSRMGMNIIELTTNGILLTPYLQKKGQLPQGLKLVKISFDTPDAERFKMITGGGDVQKVIDGVKDIGTQIKTRANKVVLRSDINDLLNYLDCCQRIGFQEVELMNLNFNPSRNTKREKEYYENEYVPVPKLLDFLGNKLGLSFSMKSCFYDAWLSADFHIIVRDNHISLRDEQCFKCPIFCQEGRYCARLATDGNITTCIDYLGIMPSIDGVTDLAKGILFEEIVELADKLASTSKLNTYSDFLKFHKLSIENRL